MFETTTQDNMKFIIFNMQKKRPNELLKVLIGLNLWICSTAPARCQCMRSVFHPLSRIWLNTVMFDIFMQIVQVNKHTCFFLVVSWCHKVVSDLNCKVLNGISTLIDFQPSLAHVTQPTVWWFTFSKSQDPSFHHVLIAWPQRINQSKVKNPGICVFHKGLV